jgi:hypothetical protein
VSQLPGLEKFRPRPVADLNRDLSRRYGLPVDLSTKTGGLEVIAEALNRGDFIHAHIATLHLQIPIRRLWRKLRSRQHKFLR